MSICPGEFVLEPLEVVDFIDVLLDMNESVFTIPDIILDIGMLLSVFI